MILEHELDNLLFQGMIGWKDMENSNFFITGATGLIGAMLVRTLLYANLHKEKKIEVYCLVRDRQKAIKLFGENAEEYGLHLIEGDVLKEINVNAKIDFIIHCASITNSKYMVDYPVETLLTSFQGTKNVLEFARNCSAKSMVYISSMEVYGAVFDEERADENRLGYIDILNVRSAYSEGKRICENLCKSYQSEYGVNVKIARLAQTFGPGVPKEETRVFAQFARCVMKHENIVLHTEGKSVGNYCDTIDMVKAVVSILLKGKSGEAYNVVNEETTMNIRQMAELVIHEFGDDNMKVVMDIPESDLLYGYAPETHLRLSGKKLSELGWKPMYGLKSMYERMMNVWKEEEI